MASECRVVVDTNVLVSSLLAGNSIPALALTKAENSGQLLTSATTLSEIGEVLRRPNLPSIYQLKP